MRITAPTQEEAERQYELYELAGLYEPDGKPRTREIVRIERRE